MARSVKARSAAPTTVSVVSIVTLALLSPSVFTATHHPAAWCSLADVANSVKFGHLRERHFFEVGHLGLFQEEKPKIELERSKAAKKPRVGHLRVAHLGHLRG
jgi:hypothetical protein